MKIIRLFLTALSLVFISCGPAHAIAPSQDYLSNHTEFEANFLESVLDLQVFANLTESQVRHIEENFECYVKTAYGSMDEAHNLCAYVLEDYSVTFLDLLKIIERDLTDCAS